MALVAHAQRWFPQCDRSEAVSRSRSKAGWDDDPAIRLKNTTGLTLESGPVTIIEDNTYAGEALVDTLKPDENRYVSFAVDLGTRVNTEHGSTSQDIYRVRFVRGTKWTDYRSSAPGSTT